MAGDEGRHRRLAGPSHGDISNRDDGTVQSTGGEDPCGIRPGPQTKQFSVRQGANGKNADQKKVTGAPPSPGRESSPELFNLAEHERFDP
jgi:hypothetical protein